LGADNTGADPSSPCDSVSSSIHSPLSAESVRSPVTPSDRSWGANRYPAPVDAVRSPATPETFSPAAASHPIKVGFYQVRSAHFHRQFPSPTVPGSTLNGNSITTTGHV